MTFTKGAQMTSDEVKRFFPNVVDSIPNKDIVEYAPIMELDNFSSFFVTMMRTNDWRNKQIFICTHDSLFNLIDAYYIGKEELNEDRVGTKVGYEAQGNSSLTISLTEYGRIERDYEYELDTLERLEYILTFTEVGRIEKK